jgi:hypothetical protein
MRSTGGGKGIRGLTTEAEAITHNTYNTQHLPTTTPKTIINNQQQPTTIIKHKTTALKLMTCQKRYFKMFN